MLRAGALGRPRGMGWGGRREGGSGRGTHVNPWLIHVNVWQKPLQYCKVISLQLIKMGKKKDKNLVCERESPGGQWLGLSAFTVVALGSIPGWGAKVLQGMAKTKQVCGQGLP